MPEDARRISEHLRAEQTEDGLVLKARDEAGRGKRFGMDGEIDMLREEAEHFAKWVFAHDLEED